jgi:hypothetical protein
MPSNLNLARIQLTPNSPYCKALMAGKKSSDPICKKGAKDAVGDWGFDVGEYVYKYDGHSYRAAGKQ